MLAAGFGFAGLGALVRLASADLSTAQVVFIRNIVALACLAPWLLRKPASQLRTRRPLAHLARGGFGLAAMYCFFYALERLSLAEAVLLNYSAPLFMPLFAMLWLGERSRMWTWIAVGVGFAGVYLILAPGGRVSFQPALLIGLAAGALAALALMVVRRMSDTEPPSRIVFYFSAFSTLVSGLPLLFDETPWTREAVLLMVAGGAVAVCAQLLITQAYRLAPAAQVTPFTYGTVVWAAVLGWLIWDETLALSFWLGAALVVVASIAALRSAQKPRR